jgi:anaerobic selenocysteine-containing dehydrogenase
MFEGIGRLAEGLAGRVATSRRGFLVRVGQSALGVAAALGALAVTASAQSGGVVCCTYRYGGLVYGKKIFEYYTVCMSAGSTCPSNPAGGGYLVKSGTKNDCSHC